jgi:putative ABC transport system substrate-binding protein
MIRLLSTILVVLFTLTSLAAAEVGVLWVSKSAMAQRVVRGLTARLTEIAPDIQLEFKIDLPDNAAATAVLDSWKDSKQAVICMRSPGATFLKQSGWSKPGFFGATSNPQALGVVADLAAPEANLTGVTYYIHARERVAIFRKAFPGITSLGLIVYAPHPSAAIDASETELACQELGLACEIARCTNEIEMMKAAKDFGARLDMVVLGSQNEVATPAAKLVGLIGAKPVGAYDTAAIKGTGALIGLNADDEKLGRLLAESLVAVLKSGTPISQVPVKTDAEPRIILNMTMVAKLGVTIPEEILAAAEQVQ